MTTRFFFWLMGLVVFSGVASSQDNTVRPSEIATSGRGDLRVAPTHAVVTFIVENSARTAAEAASDNARNSQATIQSLKSAGVKDSEISNGGYGVNQDFENGDRRKPRGFVARNAIRVDVSVAMIGKAIDAAVAAGTTSVSPVQFRANDLTQARRDALRIAVQEARRDAETLAEASGGSLGRLLSMTSFFNPTTMLRSSGEVVATGAVSGYGVPTELRPNDLTVIATASGRWEFVPHR